MKVRFTVKGGADLVWDGVLWSCGNAGLTAALNQQVLPPADSHGGILGQASRLLAVSGLAPVGTEIEDDTGWPDEQIGEDCIFIEEELAGLSEGTQISHHDGNDETSTETGALAAAEAQLCGGVCSDEESDADGVWDGPEREWQSLVEWCRKNSLILDGPGPHYDGGREHDVRFDPETGRWTKWTKPGLSGYTVDWNDAGEPWLRNASPGEYLARLRRQNRVMQDDIRLEGVWLHSNCWRIVTSQPDVPGRRATPEEIRTGMEALGFVRLRWNGIGYEHSESWRAGRMCIWDVHPANVVLSASGLIVPVDVIITPLPDGWAPCHFHP